jgi:CubicO group peptidase (beta-lactamase class C family)
VTHRAWFAALLLAQALPAAARDFEATVDALEHLRETAPVPAMAVVLVDGSRPAVVRGLGTADARTPFRWGSITKSFTALAALTLVSQGRIALESPVRPVLGRDYYVNPWQDTRPVRLVHLLALSAGFGELTRAEWEDNTPRPLWAALARHADERIVLWPPGLQHSYSNVPPGLTAGVIERVSGHPFETFLADRVFAPLGMTDASLAPEPGLPGGFRADGVTEIPYWHVTFRAFGALNASPRDMSRFLTALLDHGRVPGAAGLPAAMVARLFHPLGTLGATAGLEVGYGAGIYGWVRDGHLFWGHGGDADGYRSRYGVLPRHGRGYALVIDTDDPALLERMRRTVESALVADLPSHPPLRTVPVDLSPYPGRYYPSSRRFGGTAWRSGRAQAATVEIDGDGLRVIRGERSDRLLPVGEGRFIRPDDPAVTAVFVRDADGTLYLQGELGNYLRRSTHGCPDFLAACE